MLILAVQLAMAWLATGFGRWWLLAVAYPVSATTLGLFFSRVRAFCEHVSAHRRQGIGRALLERAVDALRDLGAPRVLLFTAEDNHGAQAMFDRAGFRRTMIEMTRELR